MTICPLHGVSYGEAPCDCTDGAILVDPVPGEPAKPVEIPKWAEERMAAEAAILAQVESGEICPKAAIHFAFDSGYDMHIKLNKLIIRKFKLDLEDKLLTDIYEALWPRGRNERLDAK